MTVLNKHIHGLPEGAVYIGRGSMWGNPFVIGKDGDRDTVCVKYEKYLIMKMDAGVITRAQLAQLHGKDLVCFCAPQRCHGHTLEKYAATAAGNTPMPQISEDKTKEKSVRTMKEFKLIVAGSRGFNDFARLSEAIDIMATTSDFYEDYAVSIISGMAPGADTLAVQFAQKYGVKLYPFPANWDAHGKRAGYLRNEQMAKFGDGLLAFWDGTSPGTRHMIQCMNNLKKPAHVIQYHPGT